ncbi:CD225/dispanin family protein [Nocardiopsis ansamitocini]|uniref:Interferon-induced transmembrane protein n=1 Tax=Nocardiopsis ansamitocini TaxID=1670832 RepID=A0A9W6P2I7_9ACTN|nr:CD225/dispanin family protein [Nocardiopsis ansamitocini]GLU45927.1 hypothetical protein Nans01_02780 [Nocardiopsis ansamitocini]
MSYGPPSGPQNPGGYGPPGGYPGGGPAGYPGGGQPPENYLIWAILSTLFCCLPLGVASIVFSSQVNSKWAVGDYAGAQEASEKAKKFAIWSAIGAVVAWVLIIIFYAIVIAAAVNSSGTY